MCGVMKPIHGGKSSLQFMDTQIVSYAFKGTSSESVAEQHISSVVANEFLETHSKAETSANYYLPTNWRHFRHAGQFLLSPPVRQAYRKRGLPKRYTDRLTLYFGRDYPPVVEFGSTAVSRIINARALDIFRLSTTHLHKRTRRRLIQRLEFLIDHRITCVALQPGAARLAQSLLHSFLQTHKSKKNFRNTVSDMLILAAAIHDNASLLTKDSVLVRFCADVGLMTRNGQGEWTRCDTIMTSTTHRRTSRESKAYINQSWSVRQRRGVHMDNA